MGTIVTHPPTTFAAPRRQARQATYGEVVAVLAALPLISREARRARGLSLREAARQIGCSFSTLSRIESGENCTLDHACEVLDWLDRSGGAA